MVKKYAVTTLHPRNEVLDPPFNLGEIVYSFIGNDYGGSSDETRCLGTECISVTSDPSGTKYPFRTIPKACLQEVK